MGINQTIVKDSMIFLVSWQMPVQILLFYYSIIWPFKKLHPLATTYWIYAVSITKRYKVCSIVCVR